MYFIWSGGCEAAQEGQKQRFKKDGATRWDLNLTYMSPHESMHTRSHWAVLQSMHSWLVTVASVYQYSCQGVVSERHQPTFGVSSVVCLHHLMTQSSSRNKNGCVADALIQISALVSSWLSRLSVLPFGLVVLTDDVLVLQTQGYIPLHIFGLLHTVHSLWTLQAVR